MINSSFPFESIKMKRITTEIVWCLRVLLFVSMLEGSWEANIKQTYPPVTCYKCEVNRTAPKDLGSYSVIQTCTLVDGKQTCSEPRQKRSHPSGLRTEPLESVSAGDSLVRIARSLAEDVANTAADRINQALANNQGTPGPTPVPITTRGKMTCYNTTELKSDSAALATYVTYTPSKDRDANADSMMPLLPQQPYCFTRLDLVDRGSYTERTLVRDGGFPGMNPRECFQASNPSRPELISKYLYCSASYCNNITIDDMLDKCFKDNKVYLNPAWRSLQTEKLAFGVSGVGIAVLLQNNVSNDTSNALSHRSRLEAVYILAPFVSLRALRLPGVVTGLVMLLTVLSLSSAQPPDLKCHSCGNPLTTGMYPPDRLCNDAPLQQNFSACPVRTPAFPNNLGMVSPQTGYCFILLNELFASEADKVAGLSAKRWLERGCQYPGGEPDDCLVMDQWANYPLLKRTYQLCKTNHYCNGDSADAFLTKCVPANSIAAIKTSMNDSESLRNFNAYPTEPPVAPLSTRAPLPVVESVLRYGAGNQTGGGVSPTGHPVVFFIFGVPVAAASLLIRNMT